MLGLLGCEYNDTEQRLADTRWYFTGYTNGDNIQRDYPQPQNERDYRNQRGCLSGEVYLQAGPYASAEMQTSDYCNRPVTAQDLINAYNQERIEFFLNNRAPGETQRWVFPSGGSKMQFIRRINNQDYVFEFTVYFANNDDNMIWSIGGYYNRTIGWSKYFQSVP